MKIEEVKKGIKLRCIKTTAVEKGEIVTAEKVGTSSFQYMGEYMNPEFFEPANKFEIGDNAMWNNTEVEIWGKHFEEDKGEYEYGFKYKKTQWNRGLAYESDLSAPKKSDELQKGDKFKEFSDIELEVLASGYDTKYNEMKYLCQRENGYIDCWNEHDIKEIIY